MDALATHVPQHYLVIMTAYYACMTEPAKIKHMGANLSSASVANFLLC